MQKYKKQTPQYIPMKRYLKAELIHDGYRYIKENTLVIEEDGTIVDTIDHKATDEANIESFQGILCPGFVNTHCHTELSYLKGMIPEQEGLVNFVQDVLKLREKPAEIEKNLAIAEAIENMYDEGIVAVGDICNTLDSFPAKSKSPIYFHNFFETSGFAPKQAEDRYQKIHALKTEADRLELPNCTNTLTPHALYSTSSGLIRKCIETNPKLISIHNQEDIAENQLTETKKGMFLALYSNLGIGIEHFNPTGKTALQSLLPIVEEAQDILLVHNTYTNSEDLKELIQARQHNFNLVLCPKSNLYITDTLPDFYLLFQNESANIALGTDSLASNNSLSIMEEIKTLLDKEARLDLEQCLNLATSSGAKALHIDDKFGSFVKGKKPGINQILSESELSRVI